MNKLHVLAAKNIHAKSSIQTTQFLYVYLQVLIHPQINR